MTAPSKAIPSVKQKPAAFLMHLKNQYMQISNKLLFQFPYVSIFLICKSSKKTNKPSASLLK